MHTPARATAQAPARHPVVLDVRNDYEWDAGHFEGAARPAEEEFADTPVGLGGRDLPAPLEGVDPETPVMVGWGCAGSEQRMRKCHVTPMIRRVIACVPNCAVLCCLPLLCWSTNVRMLQCRRHQVHAFPPPPRPSSHAQMYCTGGIRCDIYSAMLRQKGFKNLYTLEGGVQAYLREEGGQHWRGSLFVFDGRMAIPALNAGGWRPAQPISMLCIESFAGPCWACSAVLCCCGCAHCVVAPKRHSAASGIKLRCCSLPGATDASADAIAAGAMPAAVPCQLCLEGEGQLPHMNCANIDCNELFIACSACRTRCAAAKPWVCCWAASCLLI